MSITPPPDEPPVGRYVEIEFHAPGMPTVPLGTQQIFRRRGDGWVEMNKYPRPVPWPQLIKRALKITCLTREGELI